MRTACVESSFHRASAQSRMTTTSRSTANRLPACTTEAPLVSCTTYEMRTTSILWYSGKCSCSPLVCVLNFHLIVCSYNYNMHVKCLLRLLCLVTLLSSEQCSQFEIVRLQHAQIVNKTKYKTCCQ